METHNPVSREELMMVLAGLEQLHVRALFSQTSSAVSLRRVALEVASEVGGGPPASNVELCMCPASYRGDSCQVRRGGGRPAARGSQGSVCPMHARLPHPEHPRRPPTPIASRPPSYLLGVTLPQPNLWWPLGRLSAGL